MALARLSLLLGLTLTAHSAAAMEFTVGEARSLPAKALASRLLGEQVAAKVIDAVRHDYDGDSKVPQYVEFYTRPERTNPSLNGICRTDVITVEYNWADLDTATMNEAANAVNASQPLSIAHIEARPRYKSFPVPPGELGSDENDRAQAQACASMTTTLDAFRAPSAGDAQWLTKIQQQYSDSQAKFRFTCLPATACVEARRILPRLALNLATEVALVDCPNEKTGDVYFNCYRLTFPYADRNEYSDRSDIHGFENYAPEWILTVSAGISDGSAPVLLHSVELRLQPRPIVMH